jgi:hypothetical protein
MTEGHPRRERPATRDLPDPDHGAFREEYQRRLAAFGTGGDARAPLDIPPPLTGWQRKIIHSLAEELGLSHTSIGQDDDRHVICSKAPIAPPSVPAATVASLSLRHREHLVRDFALPIPTVLSPYFEFFLEWYQGLLHTRDLAAEMMADIRAFGGEDGHGAHLRAVKKEIVAAIRGTEAFKRFDGAPLLEYSTAGFATASVPQGRDTWQAPEAGHYFLSLDLSSANFFAMRYHDPALLLDCPSYDALVERFSTSVWVRKSKLLRQIIFSELNQPGWDRIITHTIHSLADLLHREFPLPLDRFHGVNRDEILLRTTAPEWITDVARCVEVVDRYASPRARGAIKLEAYRVRQLSPQPYFVKEILHTHRFGSGSATPSVAPNGTVRSVVFKCVPNAHFAQVFDHYATLCDPAPYPLDRSGPLYPHCLRATEHAGHPATFPDMVFDPAATPKLPQVVALDRCPLTDKTRRRLMDDHSLPMPALHSPYFEHYLQFYESFFPALAAVHRYQDATPAAARWRSGLVGVTAPPRPLLEALQVIYDQLVAFLADTGAPTLTFPLPATKELKNAFFDILRAFRLFHRSEAGQVVCFKQLVPTEASPAVLEDAMKEWADHCVGAVTQAVRATSASENLSALTTAVLDGCILGNVTVAEARGRLPPGLGVWPSLLSQYSGLAIRINVRCPTFTALRSLSPDAVLGCVSPKALFHQCCGEHTDPYLWHNPALLRRIFAPLAPSGTSSAVIAHLLSVAALDLCAMGVALVTPGKIAVDREDACLWVRLGANATTEAARETLRAALAVVVPTVFLEEDLDADVFRITAAKPKGWIAERCGASEHKDPPAEPRLLTNQIPAALLPQYLRAYLKQPIEEVDRVAWLEGGRWVLMEPPADPLGAAA